MTDIIPQVDPLAGYLERSEAIDYAVGGALGSGRYILGERVDAFEWTFAARFGGGECVSVANGTDAVELALRGLGVGLGDLVFAPSHTAVATVAAIGRCGAVPALVDCDPIHAVIDPQSLAAALAAAQDGRWAARRGGSRSPLRPPGTDARATRPGQRPQPAGNRGLRPGPRRPAAWASGGHLGRGGGLQLLPD